MVRRDRFRQPDGIEHLLSPVQKTAQEAMGAKLSAAT
jgi:hypothetical protein